MKPLSTRGITLQRGSRFWRATVELLSSMRFAVALLVLIALASLIGTVIPQQQPYSRYAALYGATAADAIEFLGLHRIYQTAWYLMMLLTLVISTTVCVLRHTPHIIAQWRKPTKTLQPNALRAWQQHHATTVAQPTHTLAQHMQQQLQAQGWHTHLQPQHSAGNNGWMLQAHKGRFSRLAYIAGHGAVVLLCLGGLLDSHWLLQLQMWWHDKTPYTATALVEPVPPQHVLSANTFGFRGHMRIVEGQQSQTAIVQLPSGVVVQQLPFTLALERFQVDYYPDGTPKRYMSTTRLHDTASAQSVPALIEVNHPYHYQGVTIYQSGFADGGSTVQLQLYPLHTHNTPSQAVSATIGSETHIATKQHNYTLELHDLRVRNVQSIDHDVEANGILGTLQQPTRPLNNSANLGPSLHYQLRDAAGQALEAVSYLRPIQNQDNSVAEFIFGVRQSPQDDMRYVRIPADRKHSPDSFMRLHSALQNPKLRQQAAQQYAKTIEAQESSALSQTALRLLNTFAGTPPNGTNSTGIAGLPALAALIKNTIPQAEQARMRPILMQILQRSILQLNQLVRQQQGLPPLDMQQAHSRMFMSQAILALSDIAQYPQPFLVRMTQYQHKQAAIFQLNRQPGKWLVYLGSLLLFLGIAGMLYIRQRKLAIWLQDDQHNSHVELGYWSKRQTPDSDHEFKQLITRLTHH